MRLAGLVTLGMAISLAAAPAHRLNRQGRKSTSRTANTRAPASKLMPDGRRWTIENLDVKTADSVCFEGSEENCRKYGRLYTWDSASKVCPALGPGWRLPSDDEWRTLAKKYGSIVADSTDSGKGAFKALLTGGDSGFNAILSGGRDPDGKFARLDAHGFYWTSTEANPSEAWMINFGKGAALMNHHSSEKARALAVRCIMDAKGTRKR